MSSYTSKTLLKIVGTLESLIFANLLRLLHPSHTEKVLNTLGKGAWYAIHDVSLSMSISISTQGLESDVFSSMHALDITQLVWYKNS